MCNRYLCQICRVNLCSNKELIFLVYLCLNHIIRCGSHQNKWVLAIWIIKCYSFCNHVQIWAGRVRQSRLFNWYYNKRWPQWCRRYLRQHRRTCNCVTFMMQQNVLRLAIFWSPLIVFSSTCHKHQWSM